VLSRKQYELNKGALVVYKVLDDDIYVMTRHWVQSRVKNSSWLVQETPKSLISYMR
jgi:hypothetical protein